MSIFSWFWDMFGSGNESQSAMSAMSGTLPNSNNDSIGTSTFDNFAVNPANGLPMVSGTGGVDIEGNPFGTDFSHDHMAASSFDDNWLSGSGGGISDW